MSWISVFPDSPFAGVSENDLHRARSRCESLVDDVFGACLGLDNCLRSIDPNEPLRQHPTTEAAAEAWMRIVDRAHDHWPCFDRRTELVIERANFNRNTQVHIDFGSGDVEHFPTVHAAANGLGRHFVNVFNYVDLEMAIECLSDVESHTRHWQNLKAITYPNVRWYVAQLSHEWRNACHWLEQRTADDGAADNGDAATLTSSSNDDRDAWMYERRKDGDTFKQIRTGLAAHPEWDALDSDDGVRKAIDRYAERTEKPRIRHRK